MKNFKKVTAAIAATLMAATMVAPMAMNVSAADITISQPVGSATGVTHTYEAYQIFTGTLSKGVLSNIEWGNGVNAGDVAEGETKLIEAINAITLSDNTKPFAECKTAADVANVLAGTSESPTADDADIAKAFASVVGKYLTGKPVESDASGKIAGLSDGYYLVQDKYNSPAAGTGFTPNTDAKTRYILKVAGKNITATAKSSAPTVVKKVKENTDVSDYSYTYGKTATSEGTTLTDDDYNDVADYNIGDTVPFKLYGTLPDTYADYEHYFYQFNDTLGSEFDFDIDSVEIAVNGSKVDIANASTDIRITKDVENSNKFYVTVEDVKEIAPNATDVITVSYNATLNSTAKIGRPGQVNAVDLTYSSNPNEEYVPKKDDKPEKPGNTGTTVEDKVIVFTYEIDATKVIKNTNIPLESAKFYLYKNNTDGSRSYYSGVKTVTMYVGGDNPTEATEEQITAGKDLKEVTKSVWTEVSAPTGESTEWTVPETISKLVSGKDGKFTVPGVDEGTYYLEETDAPDGYNKLENPIKLVVDANTLDKTTADMTSVDRQNWQFGSEGENQGEKALLDLTLVVDSESANSSTDVNKGKVEFNVENSAGSKLPSTGGMGTTLFYLGGGAMVAVAGIFLITKKRMNKDEA